MRSLVLLCFLGSVACGHEAVEPAAPPSVPAHAVKTTSREAPPVRRLIDDDANVPWPIVSPEEAGLRSDAVAKLVDAAERTGTDSLLVLRHDRVVVARTFGHPPEPIALMSVTKGFVGLAIGFLLDEGKIRSVDAPMSTWLPEWKDETKDKRKPLVTLRHILTHTSGLAHKAAAGELNGQPDRVAYVRALPVEAEPGAFFSYNNEATQLLSVVVTSATGEAIDDYLKRKLFEPLGIESFTWERDRAGNCATAWGLSLSAVDLAKVGITLRDDGAYDGKQVIPASWIAQMQTPVKSGIPHGLLVWLARDGWNFNGWLGQYLVVYPKGGIVAVRQHREPKNVSDEDTGQIGLVTFPELVRAALP